MPEVPVTIAVLPLEVTGDSESLARGFTEDLANALIGVPWLRVKSRGGASNYSGRTDIAPERSATRLVRATC